MWRRTSSRTRRTYAGTVVYDRKPRSFTVKDVIRIAKIAEYSKVDAEMARELAVACFNLIQNAYGQVWLRAIDRLESLWTLFNLIKAFLGGLQGFLLAVGIEVFEEFVKWILMNFTLIRPPKK